MGKLQEGMSFFLPQDNLMLNLAQRNRFFFKSDTLLHTVSQDNREQAGLCEMDIFLSFSGGDVI